MFQKTNKKEMQSLIQELMVDKVFNCYTRQALETVLIKGLTGKTREIIFFDIDNLHTLNDTFGYSEVDQRLKRALSLRSDDIIVRWYSGDEFIVIVDGFVDSVISRIKESLNEEGISAKFASNSVKLSTMRDLIIAVNELGRDVSNQKRISKQSSRKDSIGIVLDLGT